MAVGYDSLGTFSRTFRKITGRTPSDIRDDPPVDAPGCVVRRWSRPSSFEEAPPDRPSWIGVMLTAISHHCVDVLDQEEALAFHCGTLGFEVTSDVDLGFMRWLTIALPTQPDRHIMLEVPGPPVASDEVAAQLRGLVTKGALGAAAILTTDDCRATYEELRAKGGRVHRGADAAALRHRLRVARPLRQPRADHPAGARARHRRGLRPGGRGRLTPCSTRLSPPSHEFLTLAKEGFIG